MKQFTVETTDLELPTGARFTYQPRDPIEVGALYFLSIDGWPTMGRFHRDIAGCDWIAQPRRMIQITDKIVVKVWGLVVPIGTINEIARIVRLILFFASATMFSIIDLLDLVADPIELL